MSQHNCSETYKQLHKRFKQKEKIAINRCPFCSFKITIPNQLSCGREQCSGDRRLFTWEKWTKYRANDTQYLGDKTKRPTVDLVMNEPENWREKRESKTVLENAKIVVKPSIRGGTLWEQPTRLPQSCPCETVYEVHRKPEEIGKLRRIHHVGIPEFIKSTELGLVGEPQRPLCTNLNSDYMKYKEKRKKDLKSNIEKIDPYKPAIDDLIIQGCKLPKPPPTKMPDIPEIIIDSDKSPCEENLSHVYALRLNNSLFVKDQHGQTLTDLYKMKEEKWHDNYCTTWSYYFNVPSNKVGRSKLFIQNLGTVTIRYCWKKLTRHIPYIPESRQELVFFFNKNEDVISPGQSKDIFFTFLPERPGIYSEVWELFTMNMSFFDDTKETFVFNLYADISENVQDVNKKVRLMKYDIARLSHINIVNTIIDEAFDKATRIEPQTYLYKDKLIEGDLFVMKNPVCFYHQSEVEKMKGLYQEMLPGEEWDLAIGSWRLAMMSKEYVERMIYYEILRNSHDDLLKPWYEGDSLLEEKQRIVKRLLGRLADYMDEAYLRIWEQVVMVNNNEGAETADVETELYDNPLTMNLVHSLFYMSVREHVTHTMESCCGMLSSLDLNRWIQFNFCL